ncbi:MAG: hypothetical protein ABIB47_02420 [Candidatus Woesearchaeota archaeon]
MSSIEKTVREEKCPYLNRDDIGFYCTKDLDEDIINEKRRTVCNLYTLGFWCTDRNWFASCVWYSGVKEFED